MAATAQQTADHFESQLDWGSLAAELEGASPRKIAAALESAWLSGYQERRVETACPDSEPAALGVGCLARLGVPECVQFQIDVEELRTLITLWVELDGESIAREVRVPEAATQAAWLARVGSVLQVCMATVSRLELEDVDYRECERVAAMALTAASASCPSA